MSTLETKDSKSSDVEIHSQLLNTDHPSKPEFNQALSRLLALGLSVDDAKKLLKD